MTDHAAQSNDTIDPDEFLGALAAGIEEVLAKGFGPDKAVFTLVVHGSVGVVCVSNAKKLDSKTALSVVLQQWEADAQPPEPL